MSQEPIADLLDLSGRVAIVTGASRGIGKCIAEVFHQAGARLTLVARNAGPLEAVADALSAGEDVLAAPADVADEAQVNAFVQRTVDEFGRVDVLVNNAGVSSPGPYTGVDHAEWQRVIGANLTGAYLCCLAAAPYMEKQKSGRIINISSISGQTGGVAGGVHYGSSKAGMIGMTKTLSRDLAASNVTVNAITPGVIETSMQIPPDTRSRINELIPLGYVGQPEEIAYAALFLASRMGAYITGATIDVNGGILKR